MFNFLNTHIYINYEETSQKYFPAKKAWDIWASNTSAWLTIKGLLGSEATNEYPRQTVVTIKKEIFNIKPNDKGNIINFRREDQDLKNIMEEA